MRYEVLRPMFGRNRKLKHGEIVTKEQLKNFGYCMSKSFIKLVEDETNTKNKVDNSENKNSSGEVEIDQSLINTDSSENKAIDQTNKESDQKPKKRGRPKKVKDD